MAKSFGYRFLALFGFVVSYTFAGTMNYMGSIADYPSQVLLASYLTTISGGIALICLIAIFVPKAWALRPVVRVYSFLAGLFLGLYGFVAALGVLVSVSQGSFPGDFAIMATIDLVTACVLFFLAYTWKKPAPATSAPAAVRPAPALAAAPTPVVP